MNKLSQQHCAPCESGASPLSVNSVGVFLDQLDSWATNADASEISRAFVFKNYYQTIAFVNAIAWVANTENHHPDLEVSYNRCLVRYSTHSIGGLSDNDFICAARLDDLFQGH